MVLQQTNENPRKFVSVSRESGQSCSSSLRKIRTSEKRPCHHPDERAKALVYFLFSKPNPCWNHRSAQNCSSFQPCFFAGSPLPCVRVGAAEDDTQETVEM